MTGAPAFSLMGAAGCFLAAWLDTLRAARLGHDAAEAPGAARVLVLAVAMTLLVHGVMGYLSVWLEAREVRAGRRAPPPPPAPVRRITGLLTVMLVADAGLFVGLMGRSLAAAPAPAVLEGAVLCAIFLLVAALLAVRKRYLTR